MAKTLRQLSNCFHWKESAFPHCCATRVISEITIRTTDNTNRYAVPNGTAMTEEEFKVFLSHKKQVYSLVLKKIYQSTHCAIIADVIIPRNDFLNRDIPFGYLIAGSAHYSSITRDFCENMNLSTDGYMNYETGVQFWVLRKKESISTNYGEIK